MRIFSANVRLGCIFSLLSYSMYKYRYVNKIFKEASYKKEICLENGKINIYSKLMYDAQL